MYKHQSYPAWVYHKDHAPKLVQTEDDRKALDHGWASSPAHVNNPPVHEKLEDLEKMEPRYDSELEMKEEALKPKKKEKTK